VHPAVLVDGLGRIGLVMQIPNKDVRTLHAESKVSACGRPSVRAEPTLHED
jgi:hypothetical protein